MKTLIILINGSVEKSVATQSHGASKNILPIGAYGLCVGGLLNAQVSNKMTKIRKSSLNSHQYKSLVIRNFVFFISKCPDSREQ